MIERIRVEGFLGLRFLDLSLSEPLAIISGDNGSGKSSLADAIRFAVFRHPGRVAKVKDFGSLVSRGADRGFVEIATEDAKVTRDVASGEADGGIPLTHHLLAPLCTGDQRWADLDRSLRQRYLTDATGIGASGADVLREAKARGADPALLATLAGLVETGRYEAAAKEAAVKATEARGAWKAITGEVYGAKKAERWAAPVAKVDTAAIEAAERELAALRASIDELNQMLGRARQAREVLALPQRVAAKELEIGDLRHKLREGEARLKLVEAELAKLSREADPPQGLLTTFTCPDCGAEHRVAVDRGQIKVIEPTEARHSAPKAHEVLQEIKAREAKAQAWLAEKREAISRTEGALEAMTARLKEASYDGPAEERLTAEIESQRAKEAATQARLATLRAEHAAAQGGTERTAQAAAEHAKVIGYTKIAELVAPSGLPAELAGAAVERVNAHLQASSRATGWPLVQLDADLEPTFAGLPYYLISESERWRVDTMLAEALATLSRCPLLILDRWDVLAPGHRGACVGWLQHASAEHGRTTLLLGTLKAPLAVALEGVQTVWLERGRVSEPARKAA